MMVKIIIITGIIIIVALLALVGLRSRKVELVQPVILENNANYSVALYPGYGSKSYIVRIPDNTCSELTISTEQQLSGNGWSNKIASKPESVQISAPAAAACQNLLHAIQNIIKNGEENPHARDIFIDAPGTEGRIITTIEVTMKPVDGAGTDSLNRTAKSFFLIMPGRNYMYGRMQNYNCSMLIRH